MNAPHDLLKAHESHRVVDWHALASDVIVVAVARQDGWKAYIGAVAGANHEQEWQEVGDHGCELSSTIAAAIVPDMAEFTYTR